MVRLPRTDTARFSSMRVNDEAQERTCTGGHLSTFFCRVLANGTEDQPDTPFCLHGLLPLFKFRYCPAAHFQRWPFPRRVYPARGEVPWQLLHVRIYDGSAWPHHLSSFPLPPLRVHPQRPFCRLCQGRVSKGESPKVKEHSKPQHGMFIITYMYVLYGYSM